MINSSVENAFVKSFIDKRFQERILFELASKKKRLYAIDRFSHETEKIINQNRLVEKAVRMDAKWMEKRPSAPVYVLSYQYSDGVFLNYDEAIGYLSQTQSCAIVIHDDFCMIKSESECNETTYYFLKR